MNKPKKGKHKCTRCTKTKQYTEFYVDGRKQSGLSSWCKACSLEVARKAAEKRKNSDYARTAQTRYRERLRGEHQ